MGWFLLGILMYTLIGATLVMHTLKGMKVEASVYEWLIIILFWPLMLKYFMHWSMVQAMTRHIETLPETLDEKP